MINSTTLADTEAVSDLAAQYRRDDPVFAQWAKGYGVIRHSDITQLQIYNLATGLLQKGKTTERGSAFRILTAADRIASAALWLVAHMTYANNVYLDGRELQAGDFKQNALGHIGGSLNMVPAYIGYFAANALTASTRSWLMGQGRCVAAIDAANLLLMNMAPAHAERYDLNDEGLSRFVQDFFSYKILSDGFPESPLGSHVNQHTAGAVMEGGYLGMAELQYIHMPLPGEHLVAFLSDAAFEEQRGADWAPRWWRAEDCGVVTPILIANGRRIDQHSSMGMKGGTSWLQKHLEHNRFSPIDIDGHDPASYVWGILEMEDRMEEFVTALQAGQASYPAPLPYGIAECLKGYGFPGAGTNRAHNLPLQGNPTLDRTSRQEFNTAVRKLWVKLSELDDSIQILNQHSTQNRPKERDHPLAVRDISSPSFPELPWRKVDVDEDASAMDGIDEYFCSIVNANTTLRPRVGNPDEMSGNHLHKTLALLKHRVTDPEEGVPEALHGHVITALNEEAVVSAALANKGGINLVACYEAFAVKMLGAIRQELIFSRHKSETDTAPGWLSVPVIATSHTWENGTDEQSHQDTTFCEALMNEMNDVSKVLFPADWNSAVAALRATYQSKGQIWTLVISKHPLPVHFTSEQSRQLITDGAVRLRGTGGKEEQAILVATGSYQLREALRASERLEYAGVEHAVIYMQEPGKFRIARDSREMDHLAPKEVVNDLFPPSTPVRIFLTHTRPEPFIGTIWPLLTNVAQTPVLGYTNQGGTLNADGMLFANRCTWAHAVAAVAIGLGELPEVLLNEEEFAAMAGMGDPEVILQPTLRWIT